MSATQEADRREWYKAAPERLDWELAEFAARDLPATAVPDAEGRMVITTELPHAGEPVAIEVVFPYEYPEIEPTVFGPPGLVGRHQTRLGGNFCLLENPTLEWWPTMSAAGLVDEDLRWLLEDSQRGPDAIAAGEADMPEPLSQQVTTDASAPVVVPDPFWELELSAKHGNFAYVHGLGEALVLSEAEGIGEADRDLVNAVAKLDSQRHAGRWVEVAAEAVGSWPTSRDLVEAGLASWPKLLGKLSATLKVDRKRANAAGLIGLTFIEEGPRRGERRRAWLFLRVELDRRGHWSVSRKHGAQAFTAAERGRRIPELSRLADARILVVGAGSVGAPVIAELAKAGVRETHVVDYDSFDVNNGVRHILEPRWAGINKDVAVTIEAKRLNPFAAVTNHRLHIGNGPSARAELDALLGEVDIVLDTTGSHAAARILQRACRTHGKTLVLASLTAGSFGGEVAVFRPGGACFWCLVLSQEDGTVPAPAEGPRSNTTPIGCRSPAFSGAGFDATALAALAARITVQSFEHCEYPAFDDDYVVVNFRGPDPWRQGRLEVHPRCPLH